MCFGNLVSIPIDLRYSTFSNGIVQNNLKAMVHSEGSSEEPNSHKIRGCGDNSCKTINKRLQKEDDQVQPRPPWVPAPGYSSIPGVALITSSCHLPPHKIKSTASLRNPKINKNNIGKSKSAKELMQYKDQLNSEQVQVETNSSQEQPENKKKREIKLISSRTKNSKFKSCMKENGARKMTDFTLKSKESLTSITEILESKREEILSLWHMSQNPQSDQMFISELERANHLAIEVTGQVENLRSSILSLKKKRVISEEDTRLLNELRQKVLSKLHAFEKVNQIVNGMYKASQLIKEDEKCELKEHEVQEPAAVIYERKKKDENTSDFSPDEEVAAENNDLSPNQSKSSFSMELDKLDKLFSEGYTTAPLIAKGHVKEKSKGKSYWSKNSGLPSSAPKQSSKLAKEPIYEEYSDSEETDMDEPISKSHNYTSKPIHPSYSRRRRHSKEDKSSRRKVEYYRNKLSTVQDKLSAQEGRVEELSKHIERIESQSGFDLNMLKTNIRDKLEELEALPEMLLLSEKKLGETMQNRIMLEQRVKCMEKELQDERTRVHLLEFELKKLGMGPMGEPAHHHERYYQSSVPPQSPRFLQAPIMEDSKAAYKEEILRQKALIQKQKRELRERERKEEEDGERIRDLQRELAEAKREAVRVRESKERELRQMELRGHELMRSSEDLRKRNRFLTKQLQYIRTSYHNLFPPELVLPNYPTTSTFK